ncbi:MAG: hypothetical protein ACE5JX_00025 [Acidobacteriota bacterium]
MSTPVIAKFMFTITFPNGKQRAHIPILRLHSLARQQMTDGEVIETIDHLFECSRCLENYRLVRAGYAGLWA